MYTFSSNLENSKSAKADFHRKNETAHSIDQNVRVSVNENRSAHDYQFSTTPIFNPSTLGVQPKLKVNSATDKYEQEADSIAAQVMSMPQGGVQRKCSKCGGDHEEHIQRKPLTDQISSIGNTTASGSAQRKCAKCEEEEKIQRKENGATGGTTSGAFAGQIQSSRGGGQAMDHGTRTFMESRFGTDFGNVRIHADSRAGQMSDEINARAFTLGSDIYFNKGQYNPGSNAGKTLLAHELVHTVQQGSGGAVSGIQRKLVVNPNDSVPMAPGTVGPPLPLTIAVQGLIDQTCSDGDFKVNTATGEVTIGTANFCEPWHPPMAASIKRANNTTTPVGCECLCNVVNHARTTTVAFRAGGPAVQPDSMTNATNGTGTNGTANIDPRFQGQYRINGRWVDVPFFLLFAHEICGHANPVMAGTQVAPARGPRGGTPPHEVHSVAVERRIAAEHGLPLRPANYSGAARQRP